MPVMLMSSIVEVSARTIVNRTVANWREWRPVRQPKVSACYFGRPAAAIEANISGRQAREG